MDPEVFPPVCKNQDQFLYLVAGLCYKRTSLKGFFEFEGRSMVEVKIYLDHNGTTNPRPDVQGKILELLKSSWGNPSSIHWASREPKQILRQTRSAIAQMLGVQALEIIFNSGASEGNTTVIRGVYDLLKNKRSHFLCSSVEHPSVLKTYQYLESQGAHVDYIPVDRQGKLDLNFIKEKISTNTALVSVMLANNETGVLFPIKEVVQMAHAHGALVHSDSVQSLGKVQVNFKDLGVDYATFSGHKFYALKGVGVLYVKKGSPYQSLIGGGGQERHRRGGTENTLAISSLGFMVENHASEISSRAQKIQNLRNEMESFIQNKISGVEIVGLNSERLSNTSSLIVSGVDGETLLMSLDLKGIAVSTGAACSSGNPEPSHVLMAMGFSRQEAQCSLRISLGWDTTQEEIQYFLNTLVETVTRIRGLREPLTGVAL